MPLGSFEPLPFRHGCAATLSPFHGNSFWLVLPPACPERGGGFCEAKAGGVINSLAALCLSQPLSRLAATAPRSGSLSERFTSSQISLPHRGRWILRSKRRRELACSLLRYLRRFHAHIVHELLLYGRKRSVLTPGYVYGAEGLLPVQIE